MFRALADHSRRAIVERLIRGPASVSELAEPLNMSLPGVMQHLRVLEDCELVRSEKLGRVRTCRLEPSGLILAGDWISRQQREWQARLDRLGAFLDEQQAQTDDRGSI